MPSSLTPENLEAHGYSLHVNLLHSALVDFIKQYFFMNNPVILFYWCFNAVVLLLGVAGLFLSASPGDNALDIFLGFALFFPLIPLHELIHGLGYRLAGAKRVSYKAQWRQLVFYAMADRFVAGKGWFTLLALAPFVLINTTLLLLFFTLPEKGAWISYGALFMHTAGCAGDFALLSYFHTFWDRDPVTYDDVQSGQSFFYLKNA